MFVIPAPLMLQRIVTGITCLVKDDCVIPIMVGDICSDQRLE